MGDFHDDPVTYYSDDEMVMKRKGNIPFGGLRSKKGHPIYSREDIREQYCINRKELQVFEDNIYHQRGLFGCLSTSHLPDNSPCKNSYLFSCMQKGKCSTDLEPEDSFRNRMIGGDGSESKGSSGRRYRCSRDDYDDENVENEDEDSDGGFKRRPKPRTCALLEQSKSSWSAHHGRVSASSMGGGGGSSATNFKAFERFPISSNTNVSQPCVHYVSGYKLNYKQIVSTNRPKLLEFKSPKEISGPYCSSTSKSVDELNADCSSDAWAVKASPALRPISTNHPQSIDYHQNQCHPGFDGHSQAQGQQPPTRDERTKHVSFDCSNLIRSNTVASGLETSPPTGLPPPLSTSLSSHHFHHAAESSSAQFSHRLYSLSSTTTTTTQIDAAFLNPLSPDSINPINNSFHPPHPSHSHLHHLPPKHQQHSSQFNSNALCAQSQERLITGSFRSIEKCDSLMRNSSSLLANQSLQQLNQPYLQMNKQSQVRSMRRVVMKTHATQTETSLARGNQSTKPKPISTATPSAHFDSICNPSQSVPEYLPLSPDNNRGDHANISGRKPDGNWKRSSGEYDEEDETDDDDDGYHNKQFNHHHPTAGKYSGYHRQLKQPSTQPIQPHQQYPQHKHHRAHHHHNYHTSFASNRRFQGSEGDPVNNDCANNSKNDIANTNDPTVRVKLLSPEDSDDDDDDDNGRESSKGRERVRSYNMQSKDYLPDERATKTRARVRTKVQRSLSVDDDNVDIVGGVGGGDSVDWSKKSMQTDDINDEHNINNNMLSSKSVDGKNLIQSNQKHLDSSQPITPSTYNQRNFVKSISSEQIDYDQPSLTQSLGGANYHHPSSANQTRNHVSDFRDIGLYRRHSVAADFITDLSVPVLYPPPGFEDRSSPTMSKGVTTTTNTATTSTITSAEHKESTTKGKSVSSKSSSLTSTSSSSTSSSKACASGDGTDEGDHSLTEMDEDMGGGGEEGIAGGCDDDDLDSPTLVSELSSALVESLDQQKGKIRSSDNIIQDNLDDNAKVSSSNQYESHLVDKVIDNNCVNQPNEGQVSSTIRLLSLPCSGSESIINSNENVDLISPVKSEPSEVESSVQVEEFPENRKTSGSGSSIYITAAEEEEEEEEAKYKDKDKDKDEGNVNMIEVDNDENEETSNGKIDNHQQINQTINSMKGFTSPSNQSVLDGSTSSIISFPSYDETEYHPTHHQNEFKAHLTPTGLRVRHKSGSVVNEDYDDNNDSHEIINRSSESETEIDSPSYWKKEKIESPASEIISPGGSGMSGLSKSTPCDLEIDQDSELTHGTHDDSTPIHEGFSSDPSSTATREHVTVVDTKRVSKLTCSPTTDTEVTIKSEEDESEEEKEMIASEKINQVILDEMKDNSSGQPANNNNQIEIPSQVSEENSMENTMEVTTITLSSLPTGELISTSSSSSSTTTPVHTNDSIVIGDDSEGDPVESDDLEAFASSDKDNGGQKDIADSRNGVVSSTSSAAAVAEKEFSLSALNIFCRRTLSGELSTVSEVSEEISGAVKSNNELDEDLKSVSQSGSHEAVEAVPGLKDSTSTEATLNNKEDDAAMIMVETGDYADDGQFVDDGDKKNSSEVNQMYISNNNDRTEVSSPSSFSDSTTSGSFVIDGQTSEPHSMLLDEGPIEVTDGQEDHDILEEKVNPMGNRENLECKVIDRVQSAGEKENNKILKRVQLSSEASILGESYEDEEHQEETEECKSNNNHGHHGHRSYRLGGGDKSSGNNNIKEDEKEEDERRLDITGGESSQATEQDMARLEFSLTQQSSQEIDEESLSMGTHGNNKDMIVTSSSHQQSIDILSEGGKEEVKDEAENVIEEESLKNLDKNGNIKLTNTCDNDSNRNLVPQGVSTFTTGLISGTNKKLRFSESKKMFHSQTLGKSDSVESGSGEVIEIDHDKGRNFQPLPHQHHHQHHHQHQNEPKPGHPVSRVPSFPIQSSLPSSGSKSTNGKKPSIERRTRSLTRSPIPLSCTHQFTCSHCGETASHGGQGHSSHATSNAGPNTDHSVRKTTDGASIASLRQPYPYRKSATIDDILSYRREDDEDIGVYSDAYKSSPWFYIGRRDELRVWCQRRLDKPAQSSKSDMDTVVSSSILSSGDGNDSVPDSESTPSEKGFKKHYEAVTHRMIHRKASIEMYKKILENTFNVEKSVLVARHNGEFGFRIHGSRPVVVSAIEKGTPAESCGLEVGDIVVSVNDINVLDASHSEVVRLAHAGSETLKLELVRTCQKLKSALKELKDDDEIFSGYLNRKSASLISSSTSTSENVWKRRYFVLRPDSCLYWYNQPKTIDPLGVINLQNCTITLIPPTPSSSPSSMESSSPPLTSSVPPTSSTHEKRFVIRIDRIDGPSSYLYSTVEETVQRWLHHLSTAANKVSRTNSYIERTLRCIHIKPLSIKDADCRGYLGIFGQKRKLWKQRYFVLKDACLYSYIDMSSSTALGVFYLHGCKVQSTSLAGKRNTFEIIPWDRKMKHLWLMAESEIDKKRWLAALEYSIDRWIKLT